MRQERQEDKKSRREAWVGFTGGKGMREERWKRNEGTSKELITETDEEEKAKEDQASE